MLVSAAKRSSRGLGVLGFRGGGGAGLGGCRENPEHRFLCRFFIGKKNHYLLGFRA